MNILFIAAKDDYKTLADITKTFDSNKVNFYLPFGIYDNHHCKEKIINVSSMEANGKYYLSISDIKAALDQEKIDHTRLILNFKNEDKVDAAIFYNPSGKLQNCEMKEILYTLNKSIPLYLYKDDERIRTLAARYRINPNLIRFNKDRENTISTKKKVLK